MKEKNYKSQITNYKQSTCLQKRQVPYDKLQITNKGVSFGQVFKAFVVEAVHGTYEKPKNNLLKEKTKSSYGLHQDSFKLQTMTALIKSFCGESRGPHGMGDLLKFVSFFTSFPNSSPAPVTCTCHLWQKRAPLAAGGNEI